MRKLIKDFREVKTSDKCVAIIAIAMFCAAIAFIPVLKLHQSTRLVRREMRRMGHYHAARVVSLERSGCSGVFIASVPVADADGRTIKYWTLQNLRPFSARHTHFRAVPFHEHD